MWVHLNKSVNVHLKFPGTKVADNRGRTLLLKKKTSHRSPCGRSALPECGLHKKNEEQKNAIVCVDGWASSESEKGREKQREGGGEGRLCLI